MANTLTSLIPDALEALDVVSREFTGFIPAVATDSEASRAAIGENVRFPIAPVESSATNTPGVNAPDTGDAVIGSDTLAITKSKHVPVRWNGEETLGTQRKGIYSTITADRFAQAFRTLTNEIESDLGALYVSASRAHGTAGTAPFGTAGNLTDFAGVNQILDENGAPKGDRQLVVDSSAMANLRGLQNTLFRVNEAGSSDMLRDGMTDRVQNLALRYSGQVATHVIGTENGLYVTSGADPIGETSISLITGSGTWTAGDLAINQETGRDANQYIVKTALAAAGELELNNPGLKIAWQSGDSIENGGLGYSANMAFNRSAIQLLTRLPAAPEGGDMAEDVTLVTDPVSGLTFELALYKQYLQNVIHVRIAWGVKAVKPEHMALLIG
jgi:hypothetical protein